MQLAMLRYPTKLTAKTHESGSAKMFLKITNELSVKTELKVKHLNQMHLNWSGLWGPSISSC